MGKILRRFVRDESGTTAIEYAVIAAGLSIVIVTVVSNPRSSERTHHGPAQEAFT
jgi:pilus assembly protein Flp/PilA